jgi:hypothetical protein
VTDVPHVWRVITVDVPLLGVAGGDGTEVKYPGLLRCQLGFEGLHELTVLVEQ